MINVQLSFDNLVQFKEDLGDLLVGLGPTTRTQLSKAKMDRLVDEHARLYGMAATVKIIADLADGECSLYSASIDHWPAIATALERNIRNHVGETQTAECA